MYQTRRPRQHASRRVPILLAVALVCTLVTACGAQASPGDQPGAAASGRLSVLVAFYPLQYAAERVGGSRVLVTNLTVPGAEPHDLELTPRDVGRVSDADLIVYLDGFQPALDDAVSTQADGTAFDVREDARLDLTAEGEPSVGTEHAERTDDERTDDGGTDGGGRADPHFWLDPLRLADVSDALAERLAASDADGADAYRTNAADLRNDLESLDTAMESGFADCATRVLVTSHTAFGYLAQRYGFEQFGLSGLSPQDDPSAADLAMLSDVVTSRGVTTVYTETLASPQVAQTVAQESGARTAVLDPLEGLAADAAGQDYLDVMRANLAALRAGQSCP